MEVLKEHIPLVDEHYANIEGRMNTPLSNVDVETLRSFVADTKDQLKHVDQDIKDARRRVNSVKPKKRRQREEPEHEAELESGGEGSASAWDPSLNLWPMKGTITLW